ncbi:MAG: RepB family plasmid replication initiator protein, partial [Candidatus Sericytochromatia bacterium]
KKLWFELVYYAFPQMGSQRKYMISLNKLKELLGWQDDTGNNDKLKQALKGLNETVVSWNIFNKDKKNTWECFPLLAGCRIPENSGVCIFEFSSFLEERFLSMGEEAYVKIDLVVSKKFQSKHSLSMYCLALDYLMLEMGYSEKKFSIQELRRYLALKEGEYKLIGHFNDRIIRPSEKEINETSDMDIQILPFKSGKKISGYKLCMSLKEGRAKEYLDRKNKLKQLPKPKAIEQQEIKFLEEPKKPLIIVKSETLRMFFARHSISITTDTFQEKLEEVKSIFDDKFEDYLLFLSKYAEEENKKGKIKNFSGFFVSLLLDDIQIHNYFFDLEQKAKELERKKSEIEFKIEFKIKEKYEISLTDHFIKYLEDNISELEPILIDIVKNKITNKVVFDLFINKDNKGIIDKTLIKDNKARGRYFLIQELKNFQSEFKYTKPTIEEWKNTPENIEYIKNLRQDLEKSLK